MENEIAYFWLILLLAFAASAIGSAFLRRRRKPLVVRKVSAYNTLPLLLDEAIESDRRTSFSIGGVEIGQNTTLASLAGLSLLYEVSRRQAFTTTSPLVTVTDGVVLTGALDMVRKAYATQDNLHVIEANTLIWLPQGERSLAFGAGVAVLNSLRDVSSNIMVGAYGSEIALVGDASVRRDSFFVGQSTRLLGQSVAYAFSETPLLTEELFASEAYMQPDAKGRQSVLLVLDVLRWSVVVAIVVIAVLNV
jgi:hypothetical protein